MTTSRDEIVRLVSLYGATCMGYMGGDRTPLNDSNATLMSAIDRVLAERDARIAVLEKALRPLADIPFEDFRDFDGGPDRTIAGWNRHKIYVRDVVAARSALAPEKQHE